MSAKRRGRSPLLTPAQKHDCRVMYYTLQMSVRAIAARMPCSESTVYKAIGEMSVEQSEFETQIEEALAPVPEWLRSWVRTTAYDRGHSAGHDEVIAIAKDMAHGIAAAIEADNANRPTPVPFDTAAKCAGCEAKRELLLAVYAGPGAVHDFPDLWLSTLLTVADGGTADLTKLLPYEAKNPWKECLIDHLAIAGILEQAHALNPEKALHDLLAWEAKVALDPAVSVEAAALRDSPPSSEVWWNDWVMRWSSMSGLGLRLSIHDARRMLAEIRKAPIEVPGADPGIEVGATQHGKAP